MCPTCLAWKNPGNCLDRFAAFCKQGLVSRAHLSWETELGWEAEWNGIDPKH